MISSTFWWQTPEHRNRSPMLIHRKEIGILREVSAPTSSFLIAFHGKKSNERAFSEQLKTKTSNSEMKMFYLWKIFELIVSVIGIKWFSFEYSLPVPIFWYNCTKQVYIILKTTICIHITTTINILQQRWVKLIFIKVKHRHEKRFIMDSIQTLGSYIFTFYVS